MSLINDYVNVDDRAHLDHKNDYFDEQPFVGSGRAEQWQDPSLWLQQPMRAGDHNTSWLCQTR